MENSTKLKPDQLYYEEIVNKLHLNKDEVIMIGNDVSDDMNAAKKAGIRGILITDHLLNNYQIDDEEFEKYSLQEFYQKIVKNVNAI
jgi:FMN phosphatase YigB (HAD superfamily)